MDKKIKNITIISITSIFLLNFFDGNKKILGRPLWFEPKKIFTAELNGKERMIKS